MRTSPSITSGFQPFRVYHRRQPFETNFAAGTSVKSTTCWEFGGCILCRFDSAIGIWQPGNGAPHSQEDTRLCAHAEGLMALIEGRLPQKRQGRARKPGNPADRGGGLEGEVGDKAGRDLETMSMARYRAREIGTGATRDG
jgi:hypothetical protein